MIFTQLANWGIWSREYDWIFWLKINPIKMHFPYWMDSSQNSMLMNSIRLLLILIESVSECIKSSSGNAYSQYDIKSAASIFSIGNIDNRFSQSTKSLGLRTSFFFSVWYFSQLRSSFVVYLEMFIQTYDELVPSRSCLFIQKRWKKLIKVKICSNDITPW